MGKLLEEAPMRLQATDSHWTPKRLLVVLGLLAMGALVLTAALIKPGGATSVTDPSSPTFAVLSNGQAVDTSMAKRLPSFIDPASAKVAYVDGSGSYIAGMSTSGEVCVAWLAVAGGNFAGCQHFSREVEDRAPVVMVLSGGYGAGPEQRLVGLVPDFIDEARLPDGRALEIKRNVFSTPSEGLAVEISGGGSSWQVP